VGLLYFHGALKRAGKVSRCLTLHPSVRRSTDDLRSPPQLAILGRRSTKKSRTGYLLAPSNSGREPSVGPHTKPLPSAPLGSLDTQRSRYGRWSRPCTPIAGRRRSAMDEKKRPSGNWASDGTQKRIVPPVDKRDQHEELLRAILRSLDKSLRMQDEFYGVFLNAKFPYGQGTDSWSKRR